MQKQTKSISLTQKLTESAVLLALSVVLSYLKLIDLPYGGSVTLCSMLPLILVAYRHGLGFGLITGFAGSLIQLLMGLKNLSYATSALAAVAIILLDYVFAFTVTGLGGLFRGRMKQIPALISGTALACLLRYTFHVIAGCTVWAGLSIPDSQALLYSLAYNATYMLPELLITLVGAAWLGGAVGFEGERLVRLKTESGNKVAPVFKMVGAAGGAAALITDVVLIASHLQNAETGDFDITGLAAVSWPTVLIVTLLGAIWLAVFWCIAKKRSNKVCE